MKCRNGHLLTSGNLTRSGKCLTCSRATRKRADKKRRERVLSEIADGTRTTCDKGHSLTAKDVSARGYCFECEREKSRKRNRRLGITDRFLECRHGHPRDSATTDKNGTCLVCIRLARQAHYRRVMADRVKAERRREYQRIWAEAKRRERGVQPRVWGPENTRLPKDSSGYGEALPVAPLLGWLAERLRVESELQLCERAGVPARRLRMMKAGQENVALHTVDRLLFACGEEHRLNELYPLEGVGV